MKKTPRSNTEKFFPSSDVRSWETHTHEHGVSGTEASNSQRHPVLVVVSGNLLDVGRILPIGRDSSIIGRDPSTDLPLNDRLVSRKHLEIAELKQINGIFSILVKDLQTTNGTFVKGKKITETWVKLGETLEIGSETILLFRTESFSRIHDSNLTLCMVSKDPLTGIYNRRAFEQLVEHAHEKSLETHQNYCMILLDVDHFKRINDTLGHPVGDRVLKAVAESICAEIRTEDIVARIGGDEFAVLLPHSGILGGSRLADRLLKSISNHCARDPDPIDLTVSIGIAEGNAHAKRPADVYEQADIALYQSKQAGRNRYTVYDDSIRNFTHVPP
ncbi:GGDEF domain-containing protein [bacterium]|nr:GGDEF domain-containing protein [candidate division CSSED10-310 bacterium]